MNRQRPPSSTGLPSDWADVGDSLRVVFQHHEAAHGKAIDRLKGEPDVSVVLLGGSIAKGTERPDSDVDLIVVVGDAAYAARLSQNRVTFFWTDLTNWPGGYVEGRFVSRSFVLAAAERGSEPTRWSFTGVRAVWGDDPEILAAIPRIPVYPEADRERRMDAFMAQMVLYRRYFWPEGVRMGVPGTGVGRRPVHLLSGGTASRHGAGAGGRR